MSAHTAMGLDVGHLRVSFDGFVAVADTSFCVAPGESFGIVGESGSGKSTVLRAICGLAPKESGTVELTGDDAVRMQKLLDVLEDLDDTQEIYHNAAL